MHSLVRTETKAEAERVGKYMSRPVVSLERLEFIEPEGRVGYRIGGKDGERESMDYLEFIARVTSHIPNKGQVMVRYYGLYANAYRGRAKKGGSSIIRVLREGNRSFSSKGWAVLIRKVYEVDPLKCPKCGGRMTVMAFLTRASVIDRIIDHLKISFTAERPPPASELQDLPLISIILISKGMMGFHDETGNVVGAFDKRKFLSMNLRVMTIWTTLSISAISFSSDCRSVCHLVSREKAIS